ncbi:HU family DNA-binding protein [Streptomyces hypolithicus]
MDKNALIEATVRKATNGGRELSGEEVERVIDALFGTVERAGTIAEGLKKGKTVTLLGFGDFHVEDTRAVLRPGHALNDYIQAG